MKRLALLIGAAAALNLVGASAVPAAPARAAQKDWTKTVVLTGDGGFRMGNPAAPVKIVEFGSMTCPHCAEFAKSAKGPLAERVRTGKVSFEFRNMVLNGVDVTASLIARCAGPAGFFRLTDDLYAAQSGWVGKISGLDKPQRDRLQALPEGQRLVGIADAGGLTQIAARAGVPPQKAKACLADPAALERLGKMHEAAAALGVTGTPTFLVNGTMIHAHDWAELEPLIRKAGG